MHWGTGLKSEDTLESFRGNQDRSKPCKAKEKSNWSSAGTEKLKQIGMEAEHVKHKKNKNKEQQTSIYPLF